MYRLFKMEEVDFIYTVGKRIDSCLVYTTCDKQLFKVQRNEPDGKKYGCYYKKVKCNAKIVIKNGVCMYVENFSKHSHAEDQERDYKSFNTELNIKQRCQSDPTLSLRQIFEEENGSTSDVDFDKMKSSMLRNKKKFLPKNPFTADEVASYLTDNIVSQLLASKESILSHEFIKRDEYAYMIFECKEILETLPEERYFNITSTMRVIPVGFFKTLLTISVVKKNMVSRAYLTR